MKYILITAVLINAIFILVVLTKINIVDKPKLDSFTEIEKVEIKPTPEVIPEINSLWVFISNKGPFEKDVIIVKVLELKQGWVRYCSPKACELTSNESLSLKSFNIIFSPFNSLKGEE